MWTFLDPQLPQGLDPGADRGAPDDGVLDDDDLLALEQFPHRVELDPDPEIPHGLGGLDEGPAHVMVPDHPHLEGNPRFLGIPDGRVVARVGEGHHKVGVHGRFLGQAAAVGLSDHVDVSAEDVAVGAGEIDELEDAKGAAGRLLGT